MPKSGFQKWWRDQLAESSNASSRSPSICPCASCFNGTGHGSSESKISPKRPIVMKRTKVFGSRESVASDLVPLCSDATWTSRSSVETLLD
ncbi:hypothetical protein HD806DRAFT_70770 [Xylariaceae sp. AK1471]|nr:hypothetical protein HD806DRAFT_70770 [Xylariaceae sp. AK1471]